MNADVRLPDGNRDGLDPSGATSRPVVGWLASLALAMALAPIVTVLHELAHYAVGRAFDFPGLVLQLTSVTDTAGANGFPDWQRGMKSAAGPLVNWLFIVGACLASRKWPAAVAAPVVGLTASMAPALNTGAWLVAAALGKNTSSIDVDEANAARFFHLPSTFAMVAIFAVTIAVAAWLVTRAPSGRRAVTVIAVVLGAIAGFSVLRILA